MKVYCQDCNWYRVDKKKIPYYSGSVISKVYMCHNPFLSKPVEIRSLYENAVHPEKHFVKHLDDWYGEPERLNRYHDCKGFEERTCYLRWLIRKYRALRKVIKDRYNILKLEYKAHNARKT